MSGLFPYEKIRKVQDDFIKNVEQALIDKKNLIVHAPTGLGKTAGVMAPALEFAIENDLTILFLTSRHTQHHLAIETLKDIKKKHDVEIVAADIIGKKWMCLQPGTDRLFSGEFNEYCKKMREDKTCEFYVNTRDNMKLTQKAKLRLADLSEQISHTEEMVDECSSHKLCAYELSLAMAQKSRIIIADYYYVFHPKISEMFLKRTNLDLTKCIVVVDEAHNLPMRIRDLASNRITSNILSMAIKEAKKHKYESTIEYLVIIQDILNKLATELTMGVEKSVSQDVFVSAITKHIDYDQLIADLDFIADAIRNSQRQSYIGAVAAFLEHWKGPTDSFVRIIKLIDNRGKPNLVLSNNCLDPSVVSGDVINNAYSTILMSGTLTPTAMYRDLLGFTDSIEATYPSPFPEHNRLNMVLPRTTTKFTARSEAQYQTIAQICAQITDEVPGNSLLIFPSYAIRDNVYKFFASLGKKTCMLEKPSLTKDEKEQLLTNFKEYQKSGAVMLAVASGSFSEGIDLPGDLLKCVVVVGLPLQQPDLETKELIRYFDDKFSKGWDYGYIFPAFNKALQSAGRCIRSETDKGVVVFLDERYLWPRYRRLFPEDMEMMVSRDAEPVTEFFN